MKALKSTLAGLALATLALGSPASADPVKIRAAWIVPASNIASILFTKKELAPHLGKSYDFEPVRYQGTPNMVTGLAVNEIEVGLLNFTSLGLGVQNAGLEDLRIVADEFQDGAAGRYSNEYFVRKDSGIKTVADLKGKIIAVNTVGAVIDVGMRAMLRKAGLEDKRDYTVVEAPFGAMKGLLLDKKADLVATGAPFSFDKELREKATPLFAQKDSLGTAELGFWVMREPFLKANKAAVVDLLEDTMRATRWYLDPKNHDEAVKIASDFAKAPPALFADWLFTQKDYYRDPELQPNIEGTQKNIELLHDLGFLKTTFEVKKYVDLSYLEEARKRLK
jgi:sulfonate transport system substrate-binding protein